MSQPSCRLVLPLLKHNRANPEPTGARETSFYPDDFLPALQGTLASLADLEVWYEIERDYLEGWPGSDEAKKQLTEARDDARERINQRIAALRADYEKRAAKLNQAWQLTKEALAA